MVQLLSNNVRVCPLMYVKPIFLHKNCLKRGEMLWSHTNVLSNLPLPSSRVKGLITINTIIGNGVNILCAKCSVVVRSSMFYCNDAYRYFLLQVARIISTSIAEILKCMSDLCRQERQPKK